MDSIFERMEVYSCTFYIEANGQIQQKTISAPRIVIEGEFMSLLHQAVQTKLPVLIKLSMQVPIWDNFDSQWIEREVYILVKNDAYVQVNGE